MQGAGRIKLNSTLISHALGITLFDELISINSKKYEDIEQCLAKWFDPINGLDEKSEILRAAISILLANDAVPHPPSILSCLVTEWLCSQNIPDTHRHELNQLAIPLCDALLDVIERKGYGIHRSARTWAISALRSVPRKNMKIFTKIADRATSVVY